MVYTFNNISKHRMLSNKKLKFKLKVYNSWSNSYVGIFLMANNRSVLLSDMYYIQLLKSDYYHHRGNMLNRCTLIKCTSRYGGSVTVPGEVAARYGCNRISDYVSISVNFKLWIDLIIRLYGGHVPCQSHSLSCF